MHYIVGVEQEQPFFSHLPYRQRLFFPTRPPFFFVPGANEWPLWHGTRCHARAAIRSPRVMRTLLRADDIHADHAAHHVIRHMAVIEPFAGIIGHEVERQRVRGTELNHIDELTI